MLPPLFICFLFFIKKYLTKAEPCDIIICVV